MKVLGLILTVILWTLAKEIKLQIMKLLLQKRINNDALVRKSPRMFYDMGLQWELSGNQVV